MGTLSRAQNRYSARVFYVILVYFRLLRQELLFNLPEPLYLQGRQLCLHRPGVPPGQLCLRESEHITQLAKRGPSNIELIHRGGEAWGILK